MELYDPFVANKLINGKQTNVVWNIGDIKFIHKSKKIVARMGKWLKKNYDILFEDGSVNMKISRCKIHDYLGTTLDFSETGEVNINMIPYIEYMVK